jgi:hypothetical protein
MHFTHQGRCAGRGDLKQSCPLRAVEEAVGDLAEDERRQLVDVFSRFEETYQPGDRVEQKQRVPIAELDEEE